MAYVDFLSPLHRQTKRDYLERVTSHDKAECAIVAKRFGQEYWDGDRQYGYGGYRYDGRWLPVAEAKASHYGLKAGDKVLDVGCGKAHLLFELTRAVPGLDVAGVDLSTYAVEHAPEDILDSLRVGEAQSLPFSDDQFDLVLCINTLHNLYVDDLERAVVEIERVGSGAAYVVVESYRDEAEKVNLLYWQLTCECLYTPSEWEWLLARFGYTGDHSFIFFE